MTDFTLRRYCNQTDFDPVYKALCEWSERTISYYVSGCSCRPRPDQIRRNLDKSNHSTVIADKNGRPIGIAYHYYWDRPGKFYKIHMRMWEKTEYASMALRQKMEELFSKGHPKMIICNVMGYEPVLLEACRMNHMEQVGCIPDYSMYDGKLFPKYIMIMKHNNWLKLQSSPSLE